MTNRITGQRGEEIAAQWLLDHGFEIIARNVVKAGVEADIVAKEADEYVVVEVKTKHSHAYGLPQEMVGWHKQQQLRRFVGALQAGMGEIAVRVDVVAVTIIGEEVSVEHLRNVVEG